MTDDTADLRAHQRSVDALQAAEQARDLAIADAAAYALYANHRSFCNLFRTAGAACSCGFQEFSDLVVAHPGEALRVELHTNRQTLARLLRDRDATRRELVSADELASALDAFFGARLPGDEDAARYRLSQALVGYRAARKARE